LEREAARGVEPSIHGIHGGDRPTHQVYSILKNLQRKKLIKAPMSKMLKKVDEGNKGTNQMSVSESENTKKHKRNSASP